MTTVYIRSTVSFLARAEEIDKPSKAFPVGDNREINSLGRRLDKATPENTLKAHEHMECVENGSATASNATLSRLMTTAAIKVGRRS